MTHQPKVLLTSVCRPLGPKYGDGESVGYELLFGQVTRAQGIFSPRATHIQYSLAYIAHNLDVPTTVLQYPSRREFIHELKKGYDYVGISFILSTYHKMQEMVTLVREYAPGSQVILGGYGTVASDEELKPYADYICREEGVQYMRKLLGEPPLQMPYDHPLVISRLKMFSKVVSATGMIFAGLGCPSGCDFCCTSHYFRRRHIRLLPTGRDIYNVMRRYLEINPEMRFTILDEDFLLNKRRALEFLTAVRKGGIPLSIFCFASIKAVSQYTAEEIVEMGIDGVWIGYEGKRSGYAKQQGRPVDELFNGFRSAGIMILASMIIGFEYQTEGIIKQEHAELMELEPTLGQFLIYGPTPGTPFYQRVVQEKKLIQEYMDDPEVFYKKCTGFYNVVKHPVLSPQDIENIQKWCFEQDYHILGPSVFRSIQVWLNGFRTWRNHPNPIIRAKTEFFKNDILKSRPLFLAGSLFGPSPVARRRIRTLRREIIKEFGPPTLKNRLLSLLAIGAAGWTKLTLMMNWFQHPHLRPVRYRWAGGTNSGLEALKPSQSSSDQVNPD